MKNPLKIYFASPLFSDMEREYNKTIVKALRDELGDSVSIYLPQENGNINDKSGYADSKMIANADTKELLDSDLLIAVLDGSTIDVGVASEIGIAYQEGIDIIGIYTDSRQGTFGNRKKVKALDEIAESQFSYINLYTIGLIKNGFMPHKLVTNGNGIVSNLDQLKRLLNYFVELKKIDGRNDNGSATTVYAYCDGFIFEHSLGSSVVIEDYHKVLQDLAETNNIPSGSEITCLATTIGSVAYNKKLNQAYRNSLVKSGNIIYTVEERTCGKVVSGYHFDTVDDKLNIKRKRYYFSVSDDLVDDIRLGDIVMVNTQFGSQRLIVVQIQDLYENSYKPTQSVIEIVSRGGN